VYDHFERKILAVRAQGCAVGCRALGNQAGRDPERAPIGSSARKHLVDAQHVVRVEADSQVEVILAGSLDHVLHSRDTASAAKCSHPSSEDKESKPQHTESKPQHTLLQEMRPASSASEDTFSFSSDTRWTQSGKSSHGVFFLPMSKIFNFGSGTPRQNRDLG